LITRLKSDEEEDSGNNFVWKNLNTLHDCIKSSWHSSCEKNIDDLMEVDIQKIVTDGEKE
jgi:hypothetical protein